MTTNDDLVLSHEEISRNSGIDADVVREALRMRKKLESMGIWVEKGSRIVSPFAVRPDRTAARQPISSGIAQEQPPRR